MSACLNRKRATIHYDVRYGGAANHNDETTSKRPAFKIVLK